MAENTEMRVINSADSTISCGIASQNQAKGTDCTATGDLCSQ